MTQTRGLGTLLTSCKICGTIIRLSMMVVLLDRGRQKVGTICPRPLKVQDRTQNQRLYYTIVTYKCRVTFAHSNICCGHALSINTTRGTCNLVSCQGCPVQETTLICLRQQLVGRVNKMFGPRVSRGVLIGILNKQVLRALQRTSGLPFLHNRVGCSVYQRALLNIFCPFRSITMDGHNGSSKHIFVICLHKVQQCSGLQSLIQRVSRHSLNCFIYQKTIGRKGT